MTSSMLLASMLRVVQNSLPIEAKKHLQNKTDLLGLKPNELFDYWNGQGKFNKPEFPRQLVAWLTEAGYGDNPGTAAIVHYINTRWLGSSPSSSNSFPNPKDLFPTPKGSEMTEWDRIHEQMKNELSPHIKEFIRTSLGFYGQTADKVVKKLTEKDALEVAKSLKESFPHSNAVDKLYLYWIKKNTPIHDASFVPMQSHNLRCSATYDLEPNQYRQIEIEVEKERPIDIECLRKLSGEDKFSARVIRGLDHPMYTPLRKKENPSKIDVNQSPIDDRRSSIEWIDIPENLKEPPLSEEELQKLGDKGVCTICAERPADSITMPCRHQVACATCLRSQPDLVVCIYCKKTIKSVFRPFRAGF